MLTHDHDEVGGAPRGALPHRLGPRDLPRERRGDRRAGGDVPVRARPAVVRGAVAREAGTTMLIIGAEPGCAFTPSEWDTEPLPD